MIGTSFTMSDLVRKFRDDIKTSQTLKDWCITNFNKELMLGIGADERREWGIEDAPFGVIIPASISTGMSQSQLAYVFDIDIGLHQCEVSDLDFVGIEEMKGVYQIDEMVNIVINILRDSARGYNAVPDFASVSFDSSTFFPLHVATITVTVQADHLIGGQLIGLGG